GVPPGQAGARTESARDLRARLRRGPGRGRHDHPLPRPARDRPGPLGAGGRGPLRGRADRVRPVHPAPAAVRTGSAVPVRPVRSCAAVPVRRVRSCAAVPVRPVRAHRGAPMTPHSSPENVLTAVAGAPNEPPSGTFTPAEGAPPLPADIAELSYEAARDQLVEAVSRLESGQGRLEESI